MTKFSLLDNIQNFFPSVTLFVTFPLNSKIFFHMTLLANTFLSSVFESSCGSCFPFFFLYWWLQQSPNSSHRLMLWDWWGAWSFDFLWLVNRVLPAQLIVFSNCSNLGGWTTHSSFSFTCLFADALTASFCIFLFIVCLIYSRSPLFFVTPQ